MFELKVDICDGYSLWYNPSTSVLPAQIRKALFIHIFFVLIIYRFDYRKIWIWSRQKARPLQYLRNLSRLGDIKYWWEGQGSGKERKSKAWVVSYHPRNLCWGRKEMSRHSRSPGIFSLFLCLWWSSQVFQNFVCKIFLSINRWSDSRCRILASRTALAASYPVAPIASALQNTSACTYHLQLSSDYDFYHANTLQIWIQ